MDSQVVETFLSRVKDQLTDCVSIRMKDHTVLAVFKADKTGMKRWSECQVTDELLSAGTEASIKFVAMTLQAGVDSLTNRFDEKSLS